MSIKKIIYFPLIMLLLLPSCASDETQKTNFFQKGMVFFEKGDFKKADLEFRNALQIDPAFADGYYMLGKAKLNQKNYKDAYISFVKTEKLQPDHMKVKLELAKIYHAAGKLDKALEKVEAFLGKYPEDHDAQLLKGAVLIRTGKFSQAVAIYEKIMKNGHGRPETFLAIASAYRGLKDYNRCENTLITGIKVHPESPILYAALNRLYINSRQINKAVKILEQGIQKNKNSVQLTVLLAKMHLGMKQLDKALKLLEQSIQNNAAGSGKQINPAKTTLADIYITVGNIAKAEKLVTQVLEKDHKNIDAQFIKGRLNLYRGNIADAVTAFERVVKAKPNFMKGHSQLATALARQGNLNRAEAVLWKALYINPHWSEIARLHARILFIRKDYQKAISQLKKYIEKNPNDIVVIADLGDLLVQLKEVDKAEIQYWKIIQKAPKNLVGYFKLNNLFTKANKHDEALKVLQKGYENNPRSKMMWKALVKHHMTRKQYGKVNELVGELIKQYPDDPFTLNFSGKIHAAKREFSKAEKIFQQAISIAPKWKEPRSNLTAVYLARGRIKQITEKLKTELKSNPENPLSYLSLAHLYLQTGDGKSAMQTYEAAYNNGIDNWEINNDYAFLLTDHSEKQQDMELALTLAKKALKKSPGHPAIFDTLGWTHYKKGDIDQARICFAKALSKSPKDPSINYHMGMAVYKTGNLTESLKYLERAIGLKKNFPERQIVENTIKELQASIPAEKEVSKQKVGTVNNSIEMGNIFNNGDAVPGSNKDIDNPLADNVVNDMLKDKEGF